MESKISVMTHICLYSLLVYHGWTLVYGVSRTRRARRPWTRLLLTFSPPRWQILHSGQPPFRGEILCRRQRLLCTHSQPHNSQCVSPVTDRRLTHHCWSLITFARAHTLASICKFICSVSFSSSKTRTAHSRWIAFEFDAPIQSWECIKNNGTVTSLSHRKPEQQHTYRKERNSSIEFSQVKPAQARKSWRSHSWRCVSRAILGLGALQTNFITWKKIFGNRQALYQETILFHL